MDNYAVGAIFLCVGFFAGTTGRFTALTIVRKYNKNSLLIFMLLTILSISAVLLIYEIIVADHGVTFHSLC